MMLSILSIPFKKKRLEIKEESLIIGNFPASKSEFLSTLTKFPSSIAYFPFVFLYFFSHDHKIFRARSFLICLFFLQEYNYIHALFDILMWRQDR